MPGRLKESKLAEGRKQAISLRLGTGDIRRIKRLAHRLGVRDSDVVRFGIKMMLSRMLPLCDPQFRGRHLVPLLAEWGPEALRHFELDATSLDEIVNGGVPPEHRVDIEDINLLLMVSTQESYAKLSLRALATTSRPPATGERRDDSPAGSMRRHLYRKYGLGGCNGETHGAAGKAPEPPALVKLASR
jgi:hypothetical protein